MFKANFHTQIKTTGKIIVVYILSFMVFTAYEKAEDCGLRVLHAAITLYARYLVIQYKLFDY
jgi:hypothetical protein